LNKVKTLEDEINEFLAYWDCEQMQAFLYDIMPLCELYDVEAEHDWVQDAVGEDNERNVRLLRTVYLISRIAEKHSGKLALVRLRFGNIYERMELNGQENQENTERVRESNERCKISQESG
jgi:hypothetical protein